MVDAFIHSFNQNFLVFVCGKAIGQRKLITICFRLWLYVGAPHECEICWQVQVNTYTHLYIKLYVYVQRYVHRYVNFNETKFSWQRNEQEVKVSHSTPAHRCECRFNNCYSRYSRLPLHTIQRRYTVVPTTTLQQWIQSALQWVNTNNFS